MDEQRPIGLREERITLRWTSEDVRAYRMIATAGVTLSVIILQGYFGTGVGETYAFISALCFAIAIKPRQGFLALRHF